MDRAQFIVMQILTNFFDSFRHLNLFIADKRLDYQAKKTEIHPLALMDINEIFIDSNIDILLRFAKDLGIKGDKQQRVVGDQATCATIRGAKRRRIDDITPLQRLTWAKENPEDFYFLWECLRVVFLLFWGALLRSGGWQISDVF